MDTGIYDAVPYPLTARAAAGIRVRTTLLDYLSLLKPRVVLLHLFTAAVAMFLAAGGVPPAKTLALVLAGGGLAAGAANTFNCYFDRDLDRAMARTRERPLPAERLSPVPALIFGLACASVGLALLAWIRLSAAILAFGAAISYVLVYTLWLKRNSALSAILSSGIGAVPPLVGWMAVTGRLELTPLLLFAIIALWTPPHFWALAMSRGEEYQKAGLPALPGKKPAVWLTAFVLLLIGTSAIMISATSMGTIFTVASTVLGLPYLLLSLRLYAHPEALEARRLYIYSIFYLAALFAAMAAGVFI